MSDEELVQCPNNPNHLVPRSQLDEHVNKCKLLMDPNQEMQMTISSDEEPRPSTSYQGSLREESSQQGGSQSATLPIPESTSFQEWRSSDKPVMQASSSSSYQESSPEGSSLQEWSFHQRESQFATLPIPESPPLRERRSPEESSDLLELSLNRLQTSTPCQMPFQCSDTSDETDLDLCGSEGSSDNQSRSRMTDIRKKKYRKVVNKKSEIQKKLKVDSSTDDSSTSSDDSVISPKDTMSDKKKKSLCTMGLKYNTKVSSTSQETDSSQEEASSQQAAILQPTKLTLQKKDEKMDDESSVDLSSCFSQEPSDPLEFEMKEPSLPGNVQQKYSEPGCSYAETTNDSVDLQRLSRKRKAGPEETNTDELTNIVLSHYFDLKNPPLKVPMEESTPLGELSTSESISSSTETTDDSIDLQRLSKKRKMKHKEMDTEETTEEKSSYLSTDLSTSLEDYTEISSLSEEDSQEQSEPVSTYAGTSDVSVDLQQLGRKRQMKHKEMDTDETTEEESSYLSTDLSTSLEGHTEKSSLSEENSKEQSRPICIPGQRTHYSEVSQQLGRKRKMEHEESDTEEILKVKMSHLSTDVTTQSEVGVAGPSSSVPKEQSKPVSFPAKTIQESVGSERQRRCKKKKYEKIKETDPVRPRHQSKPFKRKYATMNIEENKEAKRSHLSKEETIPLEVQMEESSLSGDVPDIPVTHHDETIYDTSDDSSSDTDI